MFYSDLTSKLEKAKSRTIPADRLPVLDSLIDYCQNQLNSSNNLSLNFICTHNSRRSQFSQVWAQVAASYYDIPANCYSGGVEVTAFNARAVASLKRFGFHIAANDSENPKYEVSFGQGHSPIITFSKTFDDPVNPNSDFAAIMTCSDADENCPFIPGASARIPLRYEDPKAFDGTSEEGHKYDERSLQIASELLYVFSKLSR